MDTNIKILIECIAILGYFVTFLWFRKLIYKKYPQKENRKLYSKWVKEDLTWFFIPLISGLTFLLFVFSKKIPDSGLGLVAFALKCLLLLIQVVIAVTVFPILRSHVKQLKRR